MGGQDETAQNEPLIGNTEHSQATRTVPILKTSVYGAHSSTGEPMDVTTSAGAPMGPPPARGTSPERTMNGSQAPSQQPSDQQSNGAAMPNAGSNPTPSTTQQPKVQQTAFIHKLYNMLEDPSISNLISWTDTDESFVMSPSNDFSKVLSQYFKHTNISSFVRQLNMYGFHKVSDVFQGGNTESPLWEFKHGNGNFKRGDLVGLREIKRRASRHALVHRDSYSGVKPPAYSHPGTPAEPIPPPPVDTTESRLAQLETAMYDVHHRLVRSDEMVHSMHVKNHVLVEAVSRSLQINLEVSRLLSAATPNDPAAHRAMGDLQSEIQRQTDILKTIDEPLEPQYPGSRPYFSNLSLDGPPISPRQLAQDDHRRPLLNQQQRPPPFRPAVPSHLTITPRRYGSIGGSTAASSPSSLRYQVNAPPQPPVPAQLSAIQGPGSLARRHTSADIRVHKTWPPHPSGYPPEHQQQPLPSHWPPSPGRRTGESSEDQRIRESFSSYSIQSATQSTQSTQSSHSRPSTPPFGGISNNTTPGESVGSWSWGNNRGDRFGGQGFGSGGLLKDNSGPPTRRASMAHILNPAETVEADEGPDEGMRDEEDRKRRRRQ